MYLSGMANRPYDCIDLISILSTLNILGPLYALTVYKMTQCCACSCECALWCTGVVVLAQVPCKDRQAVEFSIIWVSGVAWTASVASLEYDLKRNQSSLEKLWLGVGIGSGTREKPCDKEKEQSKGESSAVTWWNPQAAP